MSINTQRRAAHVREWNSPMTEIVEYRELPQFPGYRIGSDGSLWSRRRKYKWDKDWRRLRTPPNNKGYPLARFGIDGQKHYRLVSRLVLEAFVGPCPKGMQACHFPDIDPSNNRLCNLRWDTRKGNMADQIPHGTRRRGENHNFAKISKETVLKIRERHASGVSAVQLAEQFGITKWNVFKITSRLSWRHI